MGPKVKAEIVRVGGKYGVILEDGDYASINGSGGLWTLQKFPQYCLGTLEQAKDVLALYKEPCVVEAYVEPKAEVKAKDICPWRTHINIDRHDLYFFLAAQVVVILLAGVYFK